MLDGDLTEAAGASVRESDAHDAVVVAVRAATHQAGGFGPIDQLDDTVMTQDQLGREITHGRITRLGTAPHGEEELVLGRGDSGVGGTLLGPVEIAAEAGAEGEETLVVLVAERYRHTSIVTR